MPRHRDIRGYLGDSFLAALINECDKTQYGENQEYMRKRDKALVATVFLTAGYIHKVLKLKKSNFEFKDEDRRRRNAFFVNKMPIARQRRKKETRRFPIFYDDLMVEHLLDWIHMLPEADGYLFPSETRKGEPLGRGMAWKIIKDLGERIDFVMSPTDLRVQRMYYLNIKKGLNL